MSDVAVKPMTAIEIDPALVTVTASAANRLLSIKQEKELSDEYALRVFVAGGGCSGLQYGMSFDDQINEGDTEFYASGLRVLVDPMSAQYIGGASIDYIDSLMGGGFKIDNPNATSSCGCGSSFKPKDGEAAASGGGCGSGAGGGCGCH
ncbi:iron-sulfur cluster insertion protein ErpA [Herpetosiphon geysericola]|uniref:[Fe-S]-binding protein n=1 Tax=Herpetosiphon geysericola TaxID=70996 RepID=A0A0P6YF53_9CHLR|nr:iron-sulfur cluster insertion protein ErpA [Herpetosiphon geysericola]KPL88933.1 [Fe-S]-binding protein [Herpetosiphon geysericola]